MKPTMFNLIVAGTALIPAAAAAGSTIVGGPILADTTWDLAGSPYLVQSSVIVGANSTLTIDPGVEVRFDSGLGLTIGSVAFGPATLVAQGTDDEPILFTSTAAVPAAGDWKDIFLTDFAVDASFDGGGLYESGCVLAFCVVEFGGSGDNSTGLITCEQSTPYIVNCVIRHGSRTGVRVNAANAGGFRILASEIHDCVPGTAQSGGGLYITGGSGHLVEDCFVHDNVGANGAGISVASINGLEVSDTTMQANGANNINAGGFHASTVTALTFTDNAVVDNTASNWAGARINVTNAVISGNTFIGNDATSNTGGMHLDGSGHMVTSNTFMDNDCGNRGGGLYLNGPNATVHDNTFTGNTATIGGGGFYCGNAAGLMFTSNTVTHNTVDGTNADGGGICHAHGNNTTYANNIITDNSTTRNGGGLHFAGTGQVIVDNTFMDNTAGVSGGGMFMNGSATVTRCEIRNNTATINGGGLFVNHADVSIAGTPDEYNTVVGNMAANGSAVYHNVDFDAGGSGDLPAQSVCWGTNDLGVVQTMVYDFFDEAANGIVITFPLVEDCSDVPGDVNGDGTVDIEDLLLMLADWGSCTGCAADLNGDDEVDIDDLLVLLGNWS